MANNWDKHAQRLWLIRDAMGIKPLYWSQSQDQLAFASEPAFAWHFPGSQQSWPFLSWLSTSAFDTSIPPIPCTKDVSALPAGHMLVVEQNNAQLERWFRPQWWVPGTLRSLIQHSPLIGLTPSFIGLLSDVLQTAQTLECCSRVD